MRPLLHPTLEHISVGGILHALSDPVRVHIFAEIAVSACSHTCSRFLEISDRTIPKSTLSQHFKVLREAGLILSEKKGVELHNTPRLEVIKGQFGDLVAAIIDAHRSEKQRAIEAERSRGRRTPGKSREGAAPRRVAARRGS